jgi:hypothetical protein
MRPAPFTSAGLLDGGQYEASMAAEQRQQPRRSNFSRDHHDALEKSDIACGTVVLYRLDGGRLLARRVDCKLKRCPKCGPRLRAQAARTWTPVMAGATVYRLVVADADWPRRQRELRKAGAEYGKIPAPGAVQVVYTTAPVGVLVDDLAGQLADDFAAMPTDRRHKWLSTRWRQAAAELEQAEQDHGPTRELVGILRRSLEHVAMIAQDLGMLVGEAGASALLLRVPDDDTWQRFEDLARFHPKPPRKET